jgi:hypothetical protein
MLGLFRGCNKIEASTLLSKIHCPVRALWGDSDRISPFSDAQATLEKYGVDCTMVPNSGHSPMYDSPDIFEEWVNQCILENRSFNKAALLYIVKGLKCAFPYRSFNAFLKVVGCTFNSSAAEL